MPGNMMRSSVVASSSCSPENPGVMSNVSGRASSTPRATTPGHDGDEQAEDVAGQPVGLLLVLLEEPGVHGDERGRQHPLPEEVLQQVGDARRPP